MRKNLILWILFVVATTIELLTQIYEWETVNMVVKPLLMPFLALFFLFSIKQKEKLAYLVVVALFFSWVGDVLLIYKVDNRFFLPGLISFLITQLLYIYIFYQSSEGFKPKLFTYSTAFLMILYGALLDLLMWSKLGSMKIPVAVYTMVIMLMGISALFRKAKGASHVLVGAMLFIASDSILAVNKFYEPINAAGFWTMITYILAQFVIISGMIKFFNAKAS
ncbi:MAG: lysoplasmalogenase [Bacteroidota bacterium]